MSPRVDPATALPRQRRRHQDPLDRMVAETLDHQLMCFAQSQATFSIPELRDRLLQLPELEDVDVNALRYRVRDRLKTLLNHELVDEVGIANRRPKLFRMRPDIAAEAPADPSPNACPAEPVEASSADGAALLTHLEQERRRLQTTMQVAMGEAEHYKRLMTHFPDAGAHISPLLEAAIEQSSVLQGQWEANLKLRRALSGDAIREAESGNRESQL